MAGCTIDVDFSICMVRSGLFFRTLEITLHYFKLGNRPIDNENIVKISNHLNKICITAFTSLRHSMMFCKAADQRESTIDVLEDEVYLFDPIFSQRVDFHSEDEGFNMSRSELQDLAKMHAVIQVLFKENLENMLVNEAAHIFLEGFLSEVKTPV